jgi:hypothetical protein
MMQRKHPGEAMTGKPGALPGEAIRPLTLIVARQSPLRGATALVKFAPLYFPSVAGSPRRCV